MKILTSHSDEPLQNINFEQSVIEFLNAVKNRNNEVFLNFFCNDLPFRALLPNGIIYDTLKRFLESQVLWFQSTKGQFEFNLQDSTFANDLGIAFALVTLRDFESAGSATELRIYISFIFRKISQHWFLVHIQNTKLNITN